MSYQLPVHSDLLGDSRRGLESLGACLPELRSQLLALAWPNPAVQAIWGVNWRVKVHSTLSFFLNKNI